MLRECKYIILAPETLFSLISAPAFLSYICMYLNIFEANFNLKIYPDGDGEIFLPAIESADPIFHLKNDSRSQNVF